MTPAFVGLGVLILTSQDAFLRAPQDVPTPQRVESAAPVYPDVARRVFPPIEGMIILDVGVNEQGKVVDIKLLRGIPILDVAAVEAVKRWRYAPTLVEGVPKRVVVTEVLDLFENENSRDSFYLRMLKDRKGDVKWRLHALERLRSVPGKDGPKFRSTFAKLVKEDPNETIRVAAEAALR